MDGPLADAPIGLMMDSETKVQRLLEAYRAAFEAFDVSRIADHFSYPFLIASDGDEIDVTIIDSREAWIPQVERLVAVYRTIGVRSARAIRVRMTEFTPRLAQAIVRWRLIEGDGATLYDFDAAYTLADVGPEIRIIAIVHNETPRLRAMIERRRDR